MNPNALVPQSPRARKRKKERERTEFLEREKERVRVNSYRCESECSESGA